MSYINLSWVSLLDSITENSKSQPHLRLLDTIVFDNLNTLRPLFWVFTSPEGLLQKNNLREWTTPEIIDNIIHIISKNSHTLIFKIFQSGERQLVLTPKHETLISHSLRAIQIYHGPFPLKPKLIIHDFFRAGEDKLYFSKDFEEKLIEMTNPISHRVKALSGLTLYTLKKLAPYNIKSLKLHFYADSQFNDPWLAGFSDIITEKFEIVSPQGLPRNLSRSYSRLPTQEMKREWRSFNKGTPIIRGRPIKMFFDKKNQNKSAEKVDVEIQNTLHPSLDQGVSSLPTVQNFYGSQCQGHFCKMEMIRVPKHDTELRCLVPFYLIEMGQKSGNSPYINSSLRKIPKGVCKGLELRPISRKIHFTKQVPVCLKCYIVYYNIKAKKN